MGKKKVSKGVVDVSNLQLLDTSSDYDNYTNLAYFISEYKKAVQIISQCKDFYKNFLQNKLYTTDQLEKIPGINLLNMRFELSDYLGNCKELYQYYVYKKLSKEFASKLKKYSFGLTDLKSSLNGSPIYRVDGYWHQTMGTMLGYKIIPKNGAIINSERYSSELIYNFGYYCTDIHEPEYYTGYGCPIYLDKIPIKYLDQYSSEDYADKKDFKIKGVKVEKVYKWDKVKLKTKKDEWKWEKTDYFDFFACFTDEEAKMIEILRDFANRNKKVKRDIIYHPEKYIDLWNEYIKFKEKEIKKFLERFFEDKPERAEYAYRCSIPQKKYERGFYKYGKLCPVIYRVGDEDYSIDAYKFLNIDLLKEMFRVSDKRNKTNYYPYEEDWDDNDFDSDDWEEECMSYQDFQQIRDEFYIKRKQLQTYLEETDENAANAFKKNFAKELCCNWYYILIDDVPYEFTDNLSSVKINFKEKQNILECTYTHTDRRKKAPWPGWMPWIVTNTLYYLAFDCSTNEPIKYTVSSHSHEEKCD